MPLLEMIGWPGHAILAGLALLAVVLTLAGIGQALAGLLSVRRFAKQAVPPNLELPPVTILRPLHGDEPMLEAALASVCAQDYPDYQIVFGVQNPADPAIAVVQRLQERFPLRGINLVIDATPHGANGKIGNLINMLPLAQHDMLIIGDSDVHCAPDYLRRVMAEFAVPGTGLVTTLYAGLAADNTLPARLGATAINHGFVPGALMSRALGRQDCLGATMALRRETLAALGGLRELVDHLADDNLLGQRVRALGLRIRLATSVPATTVPEASLPALISHELRWSRTILSLVPVAFTLSCVQFPLAWAILAMALRPGWATLALFAAAWITRALAAINIDTALGLARQGRSTPAPIWLLPLRDLLSLGIMLASYVSNTVEWRGQMMHTGISAAAAPDPRHAAIAASTPQGPVLS